MTRPTCALILACSFSGPLNAGIIATDGSVPVIMNTGGTIADPALYVIGSTATFDRDFGASSVLRIGIDANFNQSDYNRLEILNSSTVTSSFGQLGGSSNEVALGFGSEWIIDGSYLRIGSSNDNVGNHIDVSGANLDVSGGDIEIGGERRNASHRLTVSGATGTVLCAGLKVGASDFEQTDNQLRVTTGGTLDCETLTIGRSTSHGNYATINGGTLNTGFMFVGNDGGTNYVHISSGTCSASGRVFLGSGSAAGNDSNWIRVSGSNSRFVAEADLWIGNSWSDDNYLEVNNGGLAKVDGELDLNRNSATGNEIRLYNGYLALLGNTRDAEIATMVAAGEIMIASGISWVPGTLGVTLSSQYITTDAEGLTLTGHDGLGGYTVVTSMTPSLPEITVEDSGDQSLDSGVASFDFQSQVIGTGATAQEVITVTNDGSATLEDLSAALSGPAPFDFVLDLTGFPSTLAPGESGSIAMAFQPTATGLREADLEISSNDADEDPFLISLEGTGNPPELLIAEAYLKASNAEDYDIFGRAVAISGDTILVGAGAEDSAATTVNGNQSDNTELNAGAAYVFIRTPAGTWEQQAYLKASNSDEFDAFGQAMDIDGDTAVIGAPGANSAYVFVRDAFGNWSEQDILSASNSESPDSFGTSVGISGDRVVVGAPNESSPATGINGSEGNGAPSSGAAYVFERSGTSWSQTAYLKASNTNSVDLFGEAVDVSGNTVVVGARLEDGGSTGVNGDDSSNSKLNSGAAYVFVVETGSWSQQAYLKASNSRDHGFFGAAVAIDSDRLVVGSHNESSATSGIDGDESSTSAPGSGAAYVFERTGVSWTQAAYLKAANTAGDDNFGTSVAISGSRVLISATGEDSNAVGVNGDQLNNSASGSGAAYLFEFDSPTWSQKAYLKATNAEATDALGSACAISGTLALFGVHSEDSAATGINGNQADNSSPNTGAGYVFNLAATTTEAAVANATAAGLTGVDTQPSASPFNDGSINLLKYAFNMNLGGPDSSTMNQGGSSGLPGARLDTSGPSPIWRVEFVRRKNSGLVYLPLKSDDLGAFEPMTGAVTVTTIDSQWERVVVEEPCNPANQSRCFSRLEVLAP